MFNQTEIAPLTAARKKDSLGCLSNQLHKDIELEAGDFTFYRKCRRQEKTSEVATPASDRGVLIGVSLSAGHRRRIISGNRSAMHEFDKDSVYIRNFEEDYRADLHGAFDFVLVEFSRAFITNTGYERSGSHMTGFSAQPGGKDPIFGHLAQVLALALDRESQASPLFIEQLGVTIGTHLVDHYGGAPAQSVKPGRRLSSLHETRAKDMLLAKTQDNVSLEEIASACNLSRSYFIRAFRETTNRTPHQWLLEQRIERSRHLLRSSDASLSEIAIACGFSDQSHFTRTFTQLVGTPPGSWRRLARS
ncbi:helix-turn-helix domain protein [Paraburkholderia xenovorans LB400]|jgi:AraC family transcriptional regulator|uniref:Transcriptional regulator, AraC family n=1 Tax=Paraburkholderia xenovorans (strain LB400) TaxID=266265 RepID=Q13QM9_PARXL|nr:AraC family transcriptional regulator [Paraburkholderia xenovorans]ABE33610.1 transcriptional regulator, AraC family [Paraburkholderia xenovorans LB400]AIP35644.1 helix-turn-helix domain protein [Paraburkholderia xenovorans LB400]NPT34110.1 helix-turn-helix domain-containing protein [Paraburkholderia xenovorans]